MPGKECVVNTYIFLGISTFLSKQSGFIFTPSIMSMQKKYSLIALASLALISVIVISSCSKEDDAQATPKTKTELISKASWKFNKATVGGGDVSGYIEACKKDNIVTFAAAGTGTADEGLTKCNSGDPQTANFTWSFQTNESLLFVSTPLFSGGNSTFTIVSLTETQLVVSQNMTISGFTQNVEITFVH